MQISKIIFVAPSWIELGVQSPDIGANGPILSS